MSSTTMGSGAVASFCRNCGKPLSDSEKAAASIYCGFCGPQFSAHYAAPPPPPYGTTGGGASPTMPVADPNVSPGLAFLLGLIPGVGAIYNGQYAKGLVHVFIFGTIISIGNSTHDLEPLVGLMAGAFYFYMPFEAYHTALKRQRGQAVDEFSSILPLQGRAGSYPVGPLLLIALGVLFLLNNLGVLRIAQVFRLWPVGLIAAGAYLLRERLAEQTRGSGGANGSPYPPPPASNYTTTPYDGGGEVRQ